MYIKVSSLSISDNAFDVYTVANLGHDLSDRGVPHPKGPNHPVVLRSCQWRSIA